MLDLTIIILIAMIIFLPVLAGIGLLYVFEWMINMQKDTDDWDNWGDSND